MAQTGIKDFLHRLTPPTRSHLLDELERLELSGDTIPGVGEVMETLRSEFRGDSKAQKRNSLPARHFFAPLEPLLIEGAPQHGATGGIQRGSLPAIWEWISRDLLPTMARDYTKAIADLPATNKEPGARQAAAAFQTKVVKSLDNTFKSAEGAEPIRAKLAAYTASPSVFDDVTKMLSALRARDEIAKFNNALPSKLLRFENVEIAKVTPLLAAFAKANPDQLPFALLLVSRRLKNPPELIRLATKAVSTKNAADIAAAPYADTVSIVLDGLDDKRRLLRIALKHERILVAKEILVAIYNTEHALRSQIDQLEQSDWGRRLDALMASITELVETETKRFPENVGHVLGSRHLRNYGASTGRMNQLAQKARDVAKDGAVLLKKMLGGAQKSRA
jgi:hypothetical protein